MRRNRFLPVTLLLLSQIFSAHISAAETTTTQQHTTRPSIGLVLSGGGARGGAHLGVLQVLEDNRIPIDYIAGTSIGAFVGGLYSTGMSIDEIQSAAAQMTWNKILEDRSTRTDRSFRRKRDDDLYLIKYQPGFWQGKLKLPRGLLQGQKVELELAEQLLHAAQIKDFTQLPIPFNAVAADIGTGLEAILSQGNLAQSIRASMSIPTVMAPALIDGKLLVDGGVTNNLPINVVKSMGADVVIAVDIGTPLVSQDEIDSALAITGQITGFLTQNGSQEQIKLLTEHDLLITPKLDNIRTGDISAFPDAIQPGIDAANAILEMLLPYSLSPNDYIAFREKLKRPDNPPLVIDRIEITNSSTLNDEYIRSRIFETRIGQPLDLAALERDIARIYGLGLFENIFYEIDNQDQKTVIQLTIRERSWGPNYLQFGGQYNSNGGGENIINLGVSYLATQLNSRAGEWRSGFQLGSELAAFTEIHQPFGPKGMYFVNPLLGYQEHIVNVSQNSESIASINVNEVFAGIGIGRELGTWGELRAGFRVSKAEVKQRIGNPPLSENTLDGGEAFLKFSLDEYDSLFFPQKGSQLSLEWLASRESLGAHASFDQLKLTAGIAKSRDRNSFLINGFYETTTNGTAPINHTFSLGGFGQLSGFLANEFNGQNRALVTTNLFRNISQGSFVPLYAGISIEHGQVSEDRLKFDLDQFKSAGSIWIGADTMIGPVYLAYGRGEGGASAGYLFLGSPF